MRLLPIKDNERPHQWKCALPIRHATISSDVNEKKPVQRAGPFPKLVKVKEMTTDQDVGGAHRHKIGRVQTEKAEEKCCQPVGLERRIRD